MSALEKFFAEQEERMNLPDEDAESYVFRLTSGARTRSTWSPPALSPSDSDPTSSTPQPSELPRKRRRICNESSGARQQSCTESLVMSKASKTTNQEADMSPTISASAKRKKSEQERSYRPDKKSKSSEDGPTHAGVSNLRVGPAKDDLKQSRAKESEAPERGLCTSPGSEINAPRPSVNDHGIPKGSVGVPLDVAVAITELEGHGADVPKTPVLDNQPYASDSAAAAAAAIHSTKAARNNISSSRPITSSTPEGRIDISSVTTPSNSAAPSLRRKTLAASKGETKKAASSTAPATKGTSSKKKEKPKLVTPLEYAQTLVKAMAEKKPGRKSTADIYLAGMRIFYYGGDMTYASESTRRKMQILVRHGATLLPTFDLEQTTHIITDTPKATFLEALKIKSLSEIPAHIPILKWNWVNSGGSKARMGRYHDFPSFADRIHFDMDEYNYRTTASNRNGKEKAGRTDGLNEAGSTDSADYSKISEFTPDKAASSRMEAATRSGLPSPPSDIVAGMPDPRTPKASSKGHSEKDPLASFYEAARAELEAEKLRGDRDDESESDEEKGSSPSPSVSSKRGGHEFRPGRNQMYACDRKGERPSNKDCLNQDVIDKLEELKGLHDAKPSEDDKWRTFTYNKAIRALRTYPNRITSYDEARQIKGIGDKTASKIMEIIETGELQRIQYERTDDVEVTQLFSGIYGVGRQIAFKWYANGCRTLDDLLQGKGGVKLSTVQRIGIKYYDDINSRMPRSEAKDIFDMIKPIALEIDPALFIEIMGSYRRGKADCGDIDIMITRPTDDGKTHSGLLKKLLAKCYEHGIITEDLSLPDDWFDLENVYRGLCRRDEHSRHRRIDFLTVPHESRGAALLYYTGDDIFNRSMRLKANKMGYSLNQKGLFSGVVRNPGDRRQKLNDGTNIASATEEEIFEKLGVPWQEPHERVRNY